MGVIFRGGCPFSEEKGKRNGRKICMRWYLGGVVEADTVIKSE